MIFGKKLLNVRCVFWISLQLLSGTFLILRLMQRDTITNVHRSSRVVPVVRVIFSGNFKCIDKFSKNIEIPNFMKIRPVGVELLHAEGHDEANSRFSRLNIHHNFQYYMILRIYNYLHLQFCVLSVALLKRPSCFLEFGSKLPIHL
jgi:hypothetical protein